MNISTEGDLVIMIGDESVQESVVTITNEGKLRKHHISLFNKYLQKDGVGFIMETIYPIDKTDSEKRVTKSTTGEDK